jgi:uncharacterized protein (TIGR02611 family)
MLDGLKRKWSEFRKSPPGHRFRERYERQRKKNKGHPNCLNVVGGIALIVVGIIFLPMPGPGSIIICFGLVLIASEFRHIAQFLDWSELRIRKFLRRFRRSNT